MQPRSIRHIVVKKLFGSYDYSLKTSKDTDNADQLLILYGDNGSGKTTILKSLFHLLASDTGRGHKSALLAIPCNRLEVIFDSGDNVWLQRPRGKLTGEYTHGLRIAKVKPKTCRMAPSNGGGIASSRNTNAFLSALKALELSLYFLSDDRTVYWAGVEGDELLGQTGLLELSRNPRTRKSEFNAKRLRESLTKDSKWLLVQSMKQAERWIQAQLVRVTAEGESNVNTLYETLLRRLAALPVGASNQPEYFVTLSSRITELESRSKSYAKYGLSPEFQGAQLSKIVGKASNEHQATLAAVLMPYVESVEKRLDAIAALQKQLDTLVTLVNSFYSRKRLSYDVSEGFRIVGDKGGTIEPSMLSSGERQLLLLFCNTVQALNRPSVFMIDEPEISLNIKWQRRLLGALLQCAAHSSIQYLFASHSIEILAQHKHNVIKLIDQSSK